MAPLASQRYLHFLKRGTIFYFAFCISVAVEITEYFQKSTVKLVVAFQKNDISIYCAISFEFPAAAAKSLQSCPTLCDPIDGSPQGSPVPGILQARTLEWVAISFSNAWKWKVKVKSLSCVRLLATSWTAAYQAPLSMGFSRLEYWSGLPYTSLSKAVCIPLIKVRYEFLLSCQSNFHLFPFPKFSTMTLRKKIFPYMSEVICLELTKGN